MRSLITTPPDRGDAKYPMCLVPILGGSVESCRASRQSIILICLPGVAGADGAREPGRHRRAPKRRAERSSRHGRRAGGRAAAHGHTQRQGPTKHHNGVPGTPAATKRVIGHFVLLGLVPGAVVGGGVVEFVEADCVAPAGDGAGGLVGLTGLVPGIFEGFVGGHGRQDPRCWLGVWRVGVAPPKHGFHASGQAHAAVVAQHLAQARVRAFDLVGHRGHLMCPGGVQVREQQALPDELVEAVTSLNETFVGVFPPSVRSACFLLQEALPARTPGLVGAYPFLSVINVVHAGELASKSVQATRGLQFGACCGGLADTAIRVEGTALDACSRPDSLARCREPASPVGDDQGRGRDPAHERAPGPRILTPSRIPAQHTIGCLGDEHHGASAQVDAVDEDDVMNLIDDRAERP